MDDPRQAVLEDMYRRWSTALARLAWLEVESKLLSDENARFRADRAESTLFAHVPMSLMVAGLLSKSGNVVKISFDNEEDASRLSDILSGEKPKLRAEENK